MHEFECPQPITLSARLTAGALTVTAEPRDTATVDIRPYDGNQASRDAAERTEVTLRGDTLVMHMPEGGWRLWRHAKIRAEVRVPEGTALRIKLASADARCYGRYGGDSSLASASGDVSVEHVAGALEVGTASGDVRLDRVDGRLVVDTASGDATIGHTSGDVAVQTASGDLVLSRADGPVQVRTVSGDVRLDAVRRGDVHLTTASGDVQIGVATGTRVWLDLSTLSGSTRSDLDVGTAAPASGDIDLSLQVRTASGDIKLHRVPVPAAAS
jgi:hypothetical protein